MSGKNVNELTQGVKGETDNMRNKFSHLEQNFKELTSGNFFGQIETMIAELKRLNELNDKHEMRYFLLCVELERRAKVIEDYSTQLTAFDEALKRRDYEHKTEITRIREEEVRNLQRKLEAEIEGYRNQFGQEKSRFERRIQELQNELARRDAEIENLRKLGFGQTDQISKMKQELQDLHYKLSAQQKAHEDDMANTRADFNATLSQMEASHKQQLDQLRRDAEDAKQREAERQRGLMAEHFGQQLSQKDSEISRVVNISEQHRMRVLELEREHQSLLQQLDSRTREANDYRDQLVGLRKTHDEYVLKISETHRVQIQKAISDREKEWKEKAEGELLRLEKELKDKKSTVLRLEQQIIHLEKENQRNSARLTDMTVERDELKSKYADLEKRMNEDLHMVQETLTIQIEERQGEIERLALQNRDLSEMYALQLEQERGKASSLGVENDMLKKELLKLRELGEQRNREIEEWRQKYRGYITSEE